MASGGQQQGPVTTGRSYPLHVNEGGATTDSYVWRKVRLTEETGAGRNVKLEVWDAGGYKVVDGSVFFDVHEHFDPEFLWYSDYSQAPQGSPGIVLRPPNAAGASAEGWLLVSGAKLAGAGIDTDAQDGWKDLFRSPKWPKATG
jgi:hypothetical protein